MELTAERMRLQDIARQLQVRRRSRHLLAFLCHLSPERLYFPSVFVIPQYERRSIAEMRVHVARERGAPGGEGGRVVQRSLPAHPAPAAHYPPPPSHYPPAPLRLQSQRASVASHRPAAMELDMVGEESQDDLLKSVDALLTPIDTVTAHNKPFQKTDRYTSAIVAVYAMLRLMSAHFVRTLCRFFTAQAEGEKLRVFIFVFHGSFIFCV